jgi:hypothetical protein
MYGRCSRFVRRSNLRVVRKEIGRDSESHTDTFNLEHLDTARISMVSNVIKGRSLDRASLSRTRECRGLTGAGHERDTHRSERTAWTYCHRL